MPNIEFDRTVSVECEIKGQMYEVDFDCLLNCSGHSIPGNTYGDPYDCYPDDCECEWEVLGATYIDPTTNEEAIIKFDTPDQMVFLTRTIEPALMEVSNSIEEEFFSKLADYGE